MRDCGWGGRGGRRETRRRPWEIPKLKGSVRGRGGAAGGRKGRGAQEAGGTEPVPPGMKQAEHREGAGRPDTREVSADLNKAISVGG